MFYVGWFIYFTAQKSLVALLMQKYVAIKGKQFLSAAKSDI